MKNRTRNRRAPLSTALFLTIAALLVTVTTRTFTAPRMQGAGKVSMRDFSFVMIAGDDLRRLPSGENHIVQKPASGKTTTPTGTVTFFIDNVTQHTSAPFTKTGTGTLILPSANSYRGTTQINNGTLNNTTRPGSDLTKAGTGTLVFSLATDAVFEFRGLSAADLARVLVETGGSTIKLLDYQQRHRPAAALGEWPPKRLVMGPAAAVAQHEGWTAGKLKSSRPESKYSCDQNFCTCKGLDCLTLADSNKCTSSISCDNHGNCWCSAR